MAKGSSIVNILVPIVLIVIIWKLYESGKLEEIFTKISGGAQQLGSKVGGGTPSAEASEEEDIEADEGDMGEEDDDDDDDDKEGHSITEKGINQCKKCKDGKCTPC